MRNQKGITLIALVITIIVLLILAGVSIAMLTGDNGLLTKSQQAVRDNILAGAKDRVSTESQALMADYLQTKYTSNTAFNQTAANYVVSKLEEKFETKIDDCNITYNTTTNSESITITEPDNKRQVKATFDAQGAIVWGAITDVSGS